MNIKSIEVVEYNSSWSDYFASEKLLLKNKLMDNHIAIYHVGSTSVPGLCAKPKIDVIVVVKNLRDSIKQVDAAGFKYRGEVNIPLHLYCTKKNVDHDVNLHVYEEGNGEIKLNIMFRDFLRSSDSARDEYADLKMRLVNDQDNHQKTSLGFTGYNLGKNDFITKSLQEIGFNELCIRFCSHYEEWDKYHEIYADCFDRKYNRNSHAFNDPEYFSMVIYLGTKIIGIIHGSYKEDEIHIIDIRLELSYRTGYYKDFVSKSIEKWASFRGCKLLPTTLQIL